MGGYVVKAEGFLATPSREGTSSPHTLRAFPRQASIASTTTWSSSGCSVGLAATQSASDGAPPS